MELNSHSNKVFKLKSLRTIKNNVLFLLAVICYLSSLPSLAEGIAHAPASHPLECSECPYFMAAETLVKTSVRVAANLTCGVRNIADWQVSWIRRRDLHVLTTGSLLYTNDRRFGIYHVSESPYWTLQFFEPIVSDGGVYECQVSTQPKLYKRYTLEVGVPEARIIGSNDIYMKSGSDINISCVVTGYTQPIHVLWYHTLPDKYNNSVEEINLGRRGGIQVVTDRHGGTSWLLVKKALSEDSGNYTCAPNYATSAIASVHILDEDIPAAMQPEMISTSADFRFYWIILLSTALFLLFDTNR